MTAPAPETRLRIIAKSAIAVGWTILYLVLGLGLSVVAYFGSRLVLRPLSSSLVLADEQGPASLLLQGLCALVGFGAATWLVGVRGARCSATELRWKIAVPKSRALLRGIAIGAIPAAAVITLALVAGGARFTPDTGTFIQYLQRVGLTIVVLAPNALSEEVIFRGVPQVVLARAWGRSGALIMISVLFALAHLFNPNPTPLAIGNIWLAGLFLGAAFYLPGGIWTSFGAHLGWNATLAACDAPVSGLPFAIPWFDYQPGGPAWLTGGPFGPEGGLIATLSIALALAWAARRIRREGT